MTKVVYELAKRLECGGLGHRFASDALIVRKAVAEPTALHTLRENKKAL